MPVALSSRLGTWFREGMSHVRRYPRMPPGGSAFVAITAASTFYSTTLSRSSSSPSRRNMFTACRSPSSLSSLILLSQH
jgi:hypothetical protein